MTQLCANIQRTGLGETGHAEDDRLIVRYATHPSSKIRGAAIKALARLNRAAQVGIFLNALKDEVPHVSRQAQKALAQKASSLSVELVWDVFKSASHVHVKRNTFSVIEKLAKWDSISLMIKALSDADEEDIVVMSRAAIERWLARFNRSFSTPTAEQLRRLRDAVKEGEGLIDENTKAQLLFMMKGFN